MRQLPCVVSIRRGLDSGVEVRERARWGGIPYSVDGHCAAGTLIALPDVGVARCEFTLDGRYAGHGAGDGDGAAFAIVGPTTADAGCPFASRGYNGATGYADVAAGAGEQFVTAKSATDACRFLASRGFNGSVTLPIFTSRIL